MINAVLDVCPATCCRQHFSSIGNKIVVSLLPVLLDTNGYKSTVTLMNSNYVSEIQSTCIPNKQLVAGQHNVRQHICIRIQVALLGNMLPGNMLPWCKRVFTLCSEMKSFLILIFAVLLPHFCIFLKLIPISSQA